LGKNSCRQSSLTKGGEWISIRGFVGEAQVLQPF